MHVWHSAHPSDATAALVGYRARWLSLAWPAEERVGKLTNGSADTATDSSFWPLHRPSWRGGCTSVLLRGWELVELSASRSSALYVADKKTNGCCWRLPRSTTLCAHHFLVVDEPCAVCVLSARMSQSWTADDEKKNVYLIHIFGIQYSKPNFSNDNRFAHLQYAFNYWLLGIQHMWMYFSHICISNYFLNCLEIT